MTTLAQQFVESIDALSEGDQRPVAVEILRLFNCGQPGR
jgi:hypothetical protein